MLSHKTRHVRTCSLGTIRIFADCADLGSLRAVAQHPLVKGFTTNPSLMRRQFMAENPWPAEYDQRCEGLFGIDLRERGYSFGAWGSGEPWVRHLGRRDRSGWGY